MNKALGAQYDRLEKARAAMDPSQRLLARPLIGQLLSACDAAFTKYDANLDKLGRRGRRWREVTSGWGSEGAPLL